MKNYLFVLLAVPGSLVLGACNPYYERLDTITMGVGDAVATNNALQTPDPWPKVARNTNIPMNGVKADKAIKRYEAGAYGGLMGFPTGGANPFAGGGGGGGGGGMPQ